MEKAPLLKITDAKVVRGGNVILNIPSLTIEEGESVAVLRPNGCGKSTLVGLVTREVFALHKNPPPVVFRGQPRMTLAEAKACTGVVSSTMERQSRVKLTVKELVLGGRYGALGMPLRKTPTKEDIEAADRAMRTVGITDLAGRSMPTLSTGQARRALIARAIVHDPDILVLDEPCAGLDLEGCWQMRRIIDELSSQGRSVLLVTHDLEDIGPYISRTILLKDGQIEAQGANEEMLKGDRLSHLFGVPMDVERRGEHYRAMLRYNDSRLG